VSLRPLTARRGLPIAPGARRSWRSTVASGLIRLQKPWAGFRSLRLQRARAAVFDQWAKGLGTSDCRRTFTLALGLRMDWIWPPGADTQPWPPRRVILYLHGGAFCLRMPNFYSSFLARLCRKSEAVGVMPDYRLAPDHPHPAGIHDCLAAYNHLLGSGFAPDSVVFVGDSAGGGLCLSVLQLVREHGLPMPRAVALISTSGDWTLSRPSFRENQHRDALFSLGAMQHFRELYLGRAVAADPLASPVFASFEKFPPMHIAVAETELLRDVSTAIADNCRAAGVPVELDVWRGLFHAFHIVPLLPESRVAVSRLVRFLDRQWSPDR